MDSCAACGCEITGARTPAGTAVHHAGKLYCGECAAMILPPETLAQLANAAHPAAGVSARPAGGVMSGDDILGDTMDDTSPQTLPQNAPETSVVRGGPKPSTRAAHVAGRGGRRGNTTAMPRSVPGGAHGDGYYAPSSGRARRRAADSTGLYIGMGAGALLLVLVAVFVFGRDSGKPAKKKPPPAAVVSEDKTPSTEYARQAQDYAAKRDVTRAVWMYGLAAERAEKEGNPEMAKRYNMQSETLKASATLTTTGGK